jgi:hypothetical protein
MILGGGLEQSFFREESVFSRGAKLQEYGAIIGSPDDVPVHVRGGG